MASFLVYYMGVKNFILFYFLQLSQFQESSTKFDAQLKQTGKLLCLDFFFLFVSLFISFLKSDGIKNINK